MIFAESIIEEGIAVSSTNVVHPKVRIGNIPGEQACSFGEKNIIEELSEVQSSQMGSNNLLEVGCVVKNSSMGSGNIIGAKCRIVNSKIGSKCLLSPGVDLENADIADGTSLYLFRGTWRSKPVDVSIMDPVLASYRGKMAVDVKAPPTVAEISAAEVKMVAVNEADGNIIAD